ncbi:MAG: fructoselysine 6-kinase [Chloroflexi bacterium]|jgi:fructoselysine 6-kinase|nr:fructoselysine 6-kinase [Anaerolineaceae bacterium]NLI44071.1 fructoselysine 6-kinase [Chloroflexota bacterium]HOE35639.1 fructoselysine 6-kinase [Anaerolineaceae bacterium]HOT25848.1 fructoselysine 6-kinase [Anaerolineaceae bacterium]HQH58103.1 fructoselysine 6-kinase [Anaerolineaceae bacterium]
MKIATVGDNSTDVYLEQGETYPGGNTVNVAVNFIRLGGQASYVGFVGTDEYGAKLKKALAAKGVDISHLSTRPGTSPYTEITLDNGNRVFGKYDEGVMEHFFLSEEDKAFISTHDLMHTSVWSRIEHDLKDLRERGVVISFDFSDQPEHACVDIAMPYVDYAFFSFQEDSPELREFLRACWSKGPKYVVATLGENGSLGFDGETFVEQKAVPSPVIDTMGCGDSFIAGFLYAVLQGQDLKSCLRSGAESAAVTIQVKGAWPVE